MAASCARFLTPSFDSLIAAGGRLVGFTDRPAIERRISGFHQDEDADWVAELECGHTQHVRHDPPWQVREWVITAAGRRGRIGTMLSCVLCAAEDSGPTM
ncbi:MAG: DUF3565 domain-containing protein [Gemmatimonadaceae bacterium]